MHPLLKQTLADLERHFRADPRCLGIYLWGSVGTVTEDDYSDVDLGLVIRDAEYPAVKAELRSVCERLCGPILAWLPEGEREGFCNFAFLFEAHGQLWLYDLCIETQGFLAGRKRLQSPRILFDPEGVLAAAGRVAAAPSYSCDRLLPAIQEYWVYAYLNGKYWKRAGFYQLLYVQNRLFEIHQRLLHAFDPDADWSWWPLNLKRLPAERQARMRLYFGCTECEEIGVALRGELNGFAQDAREACRAWGIEYPHSLEQSVRSHLVRMGLPVTGGEEE
jgi:hypothetical protein